jgi:hypothetical protein
VRKGGKRDQLISINLLSAAACDHNCLALLILNSYLSSLFKFLLHQI